MDNLGLDLKEIFLRHFRLCSESGVKIAPENKLIIEAAFMDGMYAVIGELENGRQDQQRCRQANA